MYQPSLRDYLDGVRVWIYDFDDTLFDTSIPSPSGMTVERAYAKALDRIFQQTDLLEAVGGLRNNAPSEVVQRIFERSPDFVRKSRSFFERNSHQFPPLVPNGKGVDLRLAYANDDDIGLASELLVRQKLDELLHELQVFDGKLRWPQACNGVMEYFKAPSEDPWGILSSGHDVFIEHCIRLSGLTEHALPTASITDDDLRSIPGAVEERTKPAPFLMDLMHTKIEGVSKRRFDRTQFVYIGNDPVKDGQLARNANTKFVCYNPHRRPLPADMMQVSDFRELAEARMVTA